MKTRRFLTILPVLLLFVSCAQMNPHPMDMTQAVQSAKTSADHESLAKHYEDIAKEMQLNAQEHQKKLKLYETNSYRYGKQAQLLQDHCRNLIRIYEQAVEENMTMAASHRKMATEAR